MLRKLLEEPAFAMFLDPGLGKTSISLAAYKTLREEGYCNGALVIAPLRPATMTWPKEPKRWTDFENLKVNVLHGPHKEKLLLEEADIYVVNPEGLGWLFKALKKHFRHGKPWPFDLLFIDESTDFKNTRTLRFKRLKPNLNKFARRYVLTGTPAPNGLIDLFGQIYVLDGGRALGQYYSQFTREYFDATGYGGYSFKARPDTEKRIFKVLKPIAIRMEADDYLELPEVVMHNIYVQLPAKARKVYDDIEKEYFAELDDMRTITAVSAGASMAKCRQAANGAVYTDDGQRSFAEIHDAKLEALVELLDEMHKKPTLVAYDFNHDMLRIKAKLKKAGYGDVPHLGGGVKTKDAVKIEEEWNSGELPVLLVHPASASRGINIQHGGNALAWFALTYNLEHYLQLLFRIKRSGQKAKQVFLYHLIAENTVDLLQMASVADKKETQNRVLNALKEYRRTR